MAATSADFHGLPLPVGTERRVLYNSSFRAIATYASSLADIDAELATSVKALGAIVKDDVRHNLSGRLDIVSPQNELIHVLMDQCPGNNAFIQVKYWVDL